MRGLGTLDDGKGGITVSDAEQAELLNNYISSVCTVDNGAMHPVVHIVPSDAEIRVSRIHA